MDFFCQFQDLVMRLCAWRDLMVSKRSFKNLVASLRSFIMTSNSEKVTVYLLNGSFWWNILVKWRIKGASSFDISLHVIFFICFPFFLHWQEKYLVFCNWLDLFNDKKMKIQKVICPNIRNLFLFLSSVWHLLYWDIGRLF